MQRPERVAAVGKARACFVRRRDCRVPQQDSGTKIIQYAAVVEQADTRDLKSLAVKSVPVRSRSAAPIKAPLPRGAFCCIWALCRHEVSHVKGRLLTNGDFYCIINKYSMLPKMGSDCMYCGMCGARNKDYARFCCACGAALDTLRTPGLYPLSPVNNLPSVAVHKKPAIPAQGMSIAALTNGVASLLSLIAGIGLLSIPGSIVGLIMGCKAYSFSKRIRRKNVMANFGLVLSAVALGISAFLFTVLLFSGEDVFDIVNYDLSNF